MNNHAITAPDEELTSLRMRVAELEQMLAEREQERRALREQVEMFTQTLDAIKDMVLIKGLQSRIVYANKAFRDMYSMTMEQLRDNMDVPFNDPDYTEQYIRDDTYVFTTGKVLDIPQELISRYDGKMFLYHTVKSPIFDDKGQIVKTVGISHDITESMRVEDERARLQDEIIEAQAAALAELSTPLIPISDRVVVMPLIGAMDSQRTQQVLDTLLQGVAERQAQIAIIDITGVPIIDTQVANGLIRAAQAVKLLGAQVVLTGIRPEVAQTLVGLGAELSGILTHSTLQSAIALVMRGSYTQK
jgi:rsbT co-antagonist protein RsbR